jgi:hypothetical protein
MKNFAKIFFLLLFSNLSFALQTDRAIFLFDTGETNFIACMLNYAEKYDTERLKSLDFRIILMGASLDAKHKDPFRLYPDKVISYKDLGIQELIDRNWERGQLLSDTSIAHLKKNIVITKKVWTGVSASIFRQIIELYHGHHVYCLALRDYPFVYDETTGSQYHSHIVRQEVEKVASMVALSSTFSQDEVISVNSSVSVVGHPPCEDYYEQMHTINTQAALQRIGLDPKKPIILYAGTYQTDYPEMFDQFLQYLEAYKHTLHQIQLLIVPHPRYKGIVEKKMSKRLDDMGICYRIVGEYEENPLFYIKTIEAVCCSNLVITSNATATLVLQANILSKKVIYITSNSPDKVSTLLGQKHTITPVTNAYELVQEINTSLLHQETLYVPDIFHTFGIPKGAAATLWNMFIT